MGDNFGTLGTITKMASVFQIKLSLENDILSSDEPVQYLDRCPQRNRIYNKIVQSAGAVEYTDCTSAEG